MNTYLECQNPIIAFACLILVDLDSILPDKKQVSHH